MLASRILCAWLLAAAYAADDKWMHPTQSHRTSLRKGRFNVEELTSTYWMNGAQTILQNALARRPNENVARNIIMFLGDGMSIATLAASRIFKGQQSGETGEETELSFEKFPYTGLSKTYCVDSQVADSACTATAYLSGVKANIGTIGITAAVPRSDCANSANTTNHVQSIVSWSQNAGKGTGIVTTSRVTHASPAGCYANIGDRDWESDSDIINSQNDPNVCPDIAKQLITEDPGQNVKVILGGGRYNFLPRLTVGPEGEYGHRNDGQNLITTWLDDKSAKNATSAYVWNKEQFNAIDISNTDYLLGLFEGGHMHYRAENDTNEPTLAEMTEVAIKMLQKENNGFFLFVEGARIDMAHHETRPQKSMIETIEFAKAVEVALNLTNEQDTLIVVTSDHSHTMSFSGYPVRGNDILGIADIANDNIPYSTLSYANGPGYHAAEADGSRYDISNDNLHGTEYTFPALAPLFSETHGGEDVAVFAQGPWAHLLTGVYEQSYIPNVMAYASCIGTGLTACAKN